MTDRQDPPRAGARTPSSEDSKIEEEEVIEVTGSKNIPNKFEVVSMVLNLPSGEEVVLGDNSEDRPDDVE